MALEFNILEPLGCRAPSQESESRSFIVQLGEAGDAVFREVNTLRLLFPSAWNAPGRTGSFSGSGICLKAPPPPPPLPREALRALRSSLSHTSSLLKALLSNCLGAHQHFLVGLYLCIFFVYALSLPTEI